MIGERGERRRIGDPGQHEPPVGGFAHRRRDGRPASERDGALAMEDSHRRVLSRIDGEEIEAAAQDGVHGGHDEKRAAPALGVDQELDDGDEDRARESAPQRQSGDTLAGAQRPDAPGDDGEGRLIKRRGLHAAEGCENDVEDEKVLHLRPGCKQQPGGYGGAGHQRPAQATVDRGAHGVRGEAREQHAHRRGSVELGFRPAEVGPHGLGDQGEAIEQRAPGAYLGRSEGADEPAGPRTLRGCLHAAFRQQ